MRLGTRIQDMSDSTLNRPKVHVVYFLRAQFYAYLLPMTTTVRDGSVTHSAKEDRVREVTSLTYHCVRVRV